MNSRWLLMWPARKGCAPRPIPPDPLSGPAGFPAPPWRQRKHSDRAARRARTPPESPHRCVRGQSHWPVPPSQIPPGDGYHAIALADGGDAGAVLCDGRVHWAQCIGGVFRVPAALAECVVSYVDGGGYWDLPKIHAAQRPSTWSRSGCRWLYSEPAIYFSLS